MRRAVQREPTDSDPITAGDDPPAEVEAPTEGRRFGRFVLVRRLGAGGMGQVWSAWDPQLDRKVALKLIRGASSANERLRLQREAHALAKLSHPNVVPIFEVGEQAGEIFVVMEQIDGATLRAWCTAHRRAGWRAIVAKLVDAGRGLAAAHRAGLVHRDFKPDNVLIGADGRARVVDFGLVRVGPREPASDPRPEGDATTASGPLASTITRDDAVLGTPAYMAPEQFLGEPVDARTDQFAFCVTAIEALCGQRPFRGETRLAIAAAVTGGTPTVQGEAFVPGWLVRELVRGLAIDPAQRHASMDALLAAIERDPARTRNRIMLAAVAFVGIGGAAWSAGRTSGASTPCSSAEPRMQALVSAERARTITSALLDAEVGYDPATADALVGRIVTYADGWAAAHRDACEDTRVRGEQSEALLDLRMRCLGRRETALVATVELLAEGGREGAIAAPRMIAELPDPGPCSDAEFVAADEDLDDPAIAAAREEIERVIARARAQTQAGRFADGVATATDAVARAEALGAATKAQALLALGLARQGMSDVAGARDSLGDAFFAALAGNDDDTAVGAAIGLVYAVGHSLGDDANGTLWVRHARALVHRKRVEPAREWQVENVVGVLHLRHDRLDEARAAFESALATLGEVASPTRSDILNNLGAVALRTDELGEAQRRFESALVLDLTVFGHEHPRIADALGNLGAVAVRANDAPLAKARFEQALAIRQRVLPSDHPLVIGMLGNLAGISLELGRPDEAVEFLRRVLAFYDAHASDHPIERAQARHNLAVVLHDAARDHEALAPAREALAMRLALFGPRHLDVAGSRVVLGNVLLEHGDVEEAIDELERALALRMELGASAYMIANTRMGLARARWVREPGDREALALAHAALATYGADASAHAAELAEARAWLAEREPNPRGGE